MDQCEEKQSQSKNCKNLNEEVDIAAKINQREVICPYCKSSKLTNKGKTPKTGEYRMWCSSCSKSFATIIGIELHSLHNKILNEQIVVQSDNKINNQDIMDDRIERILRNQNMTKPQYKKLNFIYFKNCIPNKTGDIRRLILEVTDINNNKLFNIDFANNDFMEICCAVADNELIVDELRKLKLEHDFFNPVGTEEYYKLYISRVSKILRRRNIKPILKRFIEYTIGLSREDLNKKFTNETTMSGVVSSTNKHSTNDGE